MRAKQSLHIFYSVEPVDISNILRRTSLKKNNRTDEILDSYIDTGADTIKVWGNNYIKENLPKLLDMLLEKVKDMLKSMGEKDRNSIHESVLSVFREGMKFGEEITERVIEYALQDCELSDDQKTNIKEKIQNYLEKIDNFE